MLALGAAIVGLAVPVTGWTGGKQASLVIDANTGVVISAFNADEPRYPASLTKMMTLYLAFESIERGRLSYQTQIKMTERGAAAQPTKLGLEPGAEFALIDGIKALVTHSANDVAIALAEHIGGGEEHFAELMTQKAHALGMSRTTFKNASGLPNSEQLTTARDMVTLGLRLHDDFPQHFKWFALTEFNYNGHTYANHNTLLNRFEGTEGIKTGYTAASGFNVVTSVKRGSKHLVGAVFGGNNAASRNQTMRMLLNMALLKASPTRTRPVRVAPQMAQRVPEPKPAPRLAAKAGAAEWSPTVAAAPAAAASAAPPPGRIEVARVRKVLIARAADPQPPPSPAQATQPVTPVRVASASGSVPTDFKLPPLASSAIAAPEATAPRLALSAPVRQIAAPATDAASAMARGAPPSTFQRQAAALQGGDPAAASRLNGPLPTSATGSAVDIQIGAYGSATEAERQLILVRTKAADLVGRAPSATPAITANGKQMWRARFSGFDATAASNICTELRRRQIDCLVAKP